MIFVTVGNWHKGFDRLIEAIDNLKKQNVITGDVFAQIGPGKYKPENISAIDFCSQNDFQKYLIAARLIISHAGMGTIAQAVKYQKPIIVVPRKAELGEHLDNHQYASVKQFESEGKILAAYEIEDLPVKLKEAENFMPKKEEESSNILSAIQEYIDSVIESKK